MNKKPDNVVTVMPRKGADMDELVDRIVQLQDQLEDVMAKQHFYRESVQALMLPHKDTGVGMWYHGLSLAGDWVDDASDKMLKELAELKEGMLISVKNK